MKKVSREYSPQDLQDKQLRFYDETIGDIPYGTINDRVIGKQKYGKTK